MEHINNNFIEGNSIPMELSTIKNEHTIPVFVKDNTVLISQANFIETLGDCLDELNLADIGNPEIRVSHPIKGRVPEARFKKKDELLPHEETLYYERMIFLNRINSVKKTLNSNELTLIVGGVKAYNYDNLNRNSIALQHFKVFVGFQVKVCSNLCVWTDGAIADIKVNNLDTLRFEILRLIKEFKHDEVLANIESLPNYTIKEDQFAQLVGRLRMYQYLPASRKALLPTIDINDTQINTVVRNYFQDEHFRGSNGEIDLWSLYNLFTNACKSSYIDRFIDRSRSASFINTEICNHLMYNKPTYLLS